MPGDAVPPGTAHTRRRPARTHRVWPGSPPPAPTARPSRARRPDARWSRPTYSRRATRTSPAGWSASIPAPRRPRRCAWTRAPRPLPPAQRWCCGLQHHDPADRPAGVRLSHRPHPPTAVLGHDSLPERVVSGRTAPAAAGDAVTLRPASRSAARRTRQQWSFNDNGAFEASLSTSKTTGALAGVCMNVATQTGPAASPWRPARGHGQPHAGLDPRPVGRRGCRRAAAVDQLLRVRPVPGRHRPGRQRRPPDRLPLQAEPMAGCRRLEPEVHHAGHPQRATHATGQIYTTRLGDQVLSDEAGHGGRVRHGETVRIGAARSRPGRSTTAIRLLPYASKFTIINGGRCLGLGDPVER